MPYRLFLLDNVYIYSAATLLGSFAAFIVLLRNLAESQKPFPCPLKAGTRCPPAGGWCSAKEFSWVSFTILAPMRLQFQLMPFVPILWPQLKGIQEK